MRLLELKSSGECILTRDLIDNIPPYAILSHTWGEGNEEVTFQDFVQGVGEGKVGYDKIRFCREQAALDDLKFFWIDTCCIDKSNSSELQEAIVSMFRWYYNARKCYVYLSDVSVPEYQRDNHLSQRLWMPEFRESRWFTRGWTLQELLASPLVEFFSIEGIRLGDKNSLEREIHEITGIDIQAIRGCSLSDFTIELRMSWAARRNTKRGEDKAYSMFGIFDIFIPIIYGEGEKSALNRLQGEINKRLQQDMEMMSFKRHEKNEEYVNRLIASLAFDNINDRYNDIKMAHEGTCMWLLDDPKYLAWIDSKKIHEHHGLLWLKGKPGSGKSTLMKFIITEAEKSRENINISFFFNARGSFLARDTLGMYRSLLFQLFSKLKSSREVFNDFDIIILPSPPDFTWNITLLKDILRLAISRIRKSKLRIFVDALDECDEDQVRNMVRFFEFLTEQTFISHTGLLVCFSSRHYPRITVTKKIEMILEDEAGHARDIRHYISKELKLDPPAVHETLRNRILDRASGVFIWVVLAVQILGKASDHGHVHNMEKKLNEIPDDIGQLFNSILSRDTQTEQETKLCLQWILFAKRPLEIEELYYAILFSISPEGLAPWNSLSVTREVMNRFILSSSKGLAQCTSSSSPTIQFIHETVRDFLLSEKGGKYILQNAHTSLLGSANDALKLCCASYYSAVCRNTTEGDLDGENMYCAWPPQKDWKRCQDYPLFEYAIDYVLQHAEAAAIGGVPQLSFLKKFSFKPGIFMSNSWSSSSKSSPSLLYILAIKNLPALITIWLTVEPDFSFSIEDEKSPMIAALNSGNVAAIRALLTPDEGKNFCGSSELRPPTLQEAASITSIYYSCLSFRLRRSEQTVVWDFMEQGYERAALAVFRSGRCGFDDESASPQLITPLYYSAARGYNLLIEFLLGTHEVNIEFGDKFQRTPLAISAQNGKDTAVRLLSEFGKADVNSRNSNGQTPLSLTALEGHQNIVTFLINVQGVEIDSQDNKGRTPFFYAASHGHEQIVKLLLQTRRVSINSRDKFSQTPLSYAVLHGHENIVKILLDTPEIEINTQDHRDRTPLSFAAEYGYRSIISCFLTCRGIKINIQDNKGRTPLDYAKLKGHWEIVKLLARHVPL